MGTKLNLVGQVYGYLYVTSENPNRANGGAVMWNCTCSCGKEVVVRGSLLKNGSQKSCGCFRDKVAREKHTKHGCAVKGSSSREYNSWHAMRSRCDNPKEAGYEHYGGRGITYDPSWKSFENFYRDMGERPEGMTLDRIDFNGNYCKENCRWATPEAQGRNKRIRKDSLYPGVTFNTSNNNWRVRMFHNKKNVEVGQFDNLLDAICAKMNYENMVRNCIN